MRLLALALALLVTPALAQQGPLNPPPYAGGIVNVPAGGTVVTKLVNRGLLPGTGSPNDLTVQAQGAITNWTIDLPNPTFDGQNVYLACVGGGAAALTVATTDGSTITSGSPTSCSAASGIVARFQYSSVANTWTTSLSGGTLSASGNNAFTGSNSFSTAPTGIAGSSTTTNDLGVLSSTTGALKDSSTLGSTPAVLPAPFDITILNSNSLVPGVIEQYNVVYGTIPSGQCLDGDVCFAQHQIQMFDSLDPVSAAGGTSTAALYIHMKGPNTNGTGQLVPLLIHGEVSNAPLVANASSYVGETIFEDSGINVGGTAGTPAGGIFGMNILARLVSSTATYWSVLQGGEVDNGVVSGASVNYRMGWSIVDYIPGGVQGTADDVALNIGSLTGAPGWKKGISFGNFNGQFPISSTGSLITSYTGTVAYGDNYTNLTCTTACFASPNFSVNGSGVVSGASFYPTSTSVPTGPAFYLQSANHPAILPQNGGLPWTYSANTFSYYGNQGTIVGIQLQNTNTSTTAYTVLDLGNNNSVTEAAITLNGSGFSGGLGANALSISNAAGALIAIGTGSEVLEFGSTGMFTANGSVATAMSSLGPTGSHATIQEWFTVKDASGTVRYIPAF